VTCLSLGREDFIEAFGNLDEFLQAKVHCERTFKHMAVHRQGL
jgi:hypothetical protein